MKLRRGREPRADRRGSQQTAKFPGADDVVTHRRPARRVSRRLRPGAASNTTPVLVLRFEADNEAALARIQDDFRRVILAREAGREAAVLNVPAGRSRRCWRAVHGQNAARFKSPRRVFRAFAGSTLIPTGHNSRSSSLAGSLTRSARFRWLLSMRLRPDDRLPLLSVQKILIVRVSSLGDVVHNMPVDRRHPPPSSRCADRLARRGKLRGARRTGERRAPRDSRVAAAVAQALLSLANWREMGAFRRALAAENYDS